MTESQAVVEDMQETDVVDGIYREGVHPWRRYFARVVDNAIGTFTALMLVMIVLAATRLDIFDAAVAWLNTVNRIEDAMITVFAGGIFSTLLLATTGSTLGKWIFGIRVREADGRRIGIARAFRREFHVWTRGLGIGIPLVCLVTMIHAYNQLDTFKQTTWDRDMQLLVTHRPSGIGQYILWVIIALAWIAFTVYTMFPA